MTMKMGVIYLTCASDAAKIHDAVGPVAQLGERYNRTVEAKGSSPFRSTEWMSPKPAACSGLKLTIEDGMATNGSSRRAE
jgi:hypothetical protein